MELNVLNLLEETCGSFGGKVWEQVQVVATVTPENYELSCKQQVNKLTGEVFDSNQILIPAGEGKVIPVSIRSGEPIDESLTYDLVQFVALRTIEGSKFVKGSKTIKAVAKVEAA